MKRLLLVLILIAGCSNPKVEFSELEQKSEKQIVEIAKDSVREFLRKRLNDPNSFEEVAWGELVENDTIYLYNAINKLNGMMEKNQQNPLSGFEAMDKELEKLVDSLTIVKKQSNLYAIRLKYRAKNAYGGVISYDNRFLLDSVFKVINRTEQ
ncbi:MAG: hypothetical protein JNL88_09510 [Bacteroidia bacterium]|nr:hypothetical protein [Bacteroidia bacterium]